MTNDEIRIAVAELCGTFIPCPDCGGSGYMIEMGHHPSCDGSCVNCPVPVQETCSTCGGACTLGDSPNYPEDLNACAEFERKLTLDQRDDYWNWLARITEKGRMTTAAWLTTTATAPQRCEAFLRLHGKWKD